VRAAVLVRACAALALWAVLSAGGAFAAGAVTPEEAAEQQRLSQQLLSQLRAALDASRTDAAAAASVRGIDLSALRERTRTQIRSSLGKPTTCDRAPYCETSPAWVYDFFPESAPKDVGRTQLLILFDVDGHCATARWETASEAKEP